MLIEFNVENFRSIKKKVTLSMVATKDPSLENNLIKTNVLKKDSLLRSAVIYGANASGKTNVLLALNLLDRIVRTSHKYQKGDKIPFEPFKLDKRYLTKPTKLDVTFIKEGIKYVYGVSFNSEKIITEYLHYYPNGRKTIIFERKKTDEYKFTIDKKEQKFIAERTLENVSYLSKATQENYKVTLAAFEWFKDDLMIIGAMDHLKLTEFTVRSLTKDKKWKKLILKALLVADVGIEDVLAEFKKRPIDEVMDMSPKLKTELLTFIMNVGGKTEVESMRIQTVHKGVVFNFDKEESEGTKRMFSLIGPWIDALEKGGILVVDELDTKLHHLLNVFLIKLFHDPTQNKNNAQLIFTTHNTNLLDQDLFRRDQLWFTEKNYETGSTDLYSLVEYSPRKDKNIERGYLAGRYGALPFIKENKVF